MRSASSERDNLQIKVFTSWVNSYLSKRQLSIDKITDGFANGFMLINLIEILWDEPITTKFNSNPRNSFHKTQNIQIAFDFLTKKGVKILGISPGEIANCSISAVLSLTCSIFNGYIEKTSFNGVKGKKGLLNWCKDVTKGYKGVNITSIRSTCNGLVYGAIINHFHPAALNYDQLSNGSSLENSKAILNGFKNLGLSSYLDEKELANLNDEIIITLVYSQLYNYFINKENLGQHQNQQTTNRSEIKPPEQNPNGISKPHPSENPSSKNLKLQDTKNDDNQKKKGWFSKFKSSKSEKKIITIEKPIERKEADYKSGNLDKERVNQAIENEFHLANYINKKYGNPNEILQRQPELIAKINDEKQDVDFYEEKFHEIINRAGTRPIISIAGIGGYQAGKSTTLCGLTGNMAYEVGDGHDETTKGVYIDGPYDIDYFYKRFNVQPRDNLLYSKNDDFKPVVYFFDIEGYGGSMHSEDDAHNKELYKKLCSPFACISSVFFMLANKNVQMDEIDTIINTLDINKLSNDDELNGNGAVKLVIGIKNYPIVQFMKPPTDDMLISQINDENMQKSVDKIKNDCKNFKKLKEKGIVATFSPMYDPTPLFMVQGYVKSFGYFARDIIRAIEIASDGHFLRDAERNINLFNFISKNYGNPNFQEILKKKIFEEHENSLQRISQRLIYEAKEQFFQLIDEQYRVNEEHIENEKDIQSVSEAYREMGRQKIVAKIGMVEDSPIVVKSIEKYYALINQYISEKESHLKMVREKYYENKKNEARLFADQKLEEEIPKSKESILKILKQNNFFGFDVKCIEKPVTDEANKFTQYLNKLKTSQMKYLDESIIKNEHDAFYNKLLLISKDLLIQEQKEKVEKEAQNEEKKRKVEEMVRKQLESAKEIEEATAKHMIVSKADEALYQLYSILEENEVEKMKNDFLSKSYYLQYYTPEAQTKLKVKINESIHQNLMNERNSIIDNLVTSYQEKQNIHIDAIKRVVEKNKEAIITKEKIDTIVSLKTPAIAQDIRNCVYEARTNLTEIEYEKQNFYDPNEKKIIIVKTRRILHPPDGQMIVEGWREARRKPKQFKIKKDKTHGKVVKISKNDYEHEHELGSTK